MVVISIMREPDNLESDTYPKLSFINIRGLRCNFVGSQYFLKSMSHVLALYGTDLDGSIDFSIFSVGLSSFNLIGFCHFYLRCCNLHEEWTSFCIRLVLWKLWGFWFMFSIDFISFSAIHSMKYIHLLW